jgi:hypothetical protein
MTRTDRLGGRTEATVQLDQINRASVNDTPQGYRVASFTAPASANETHQTRCAVRCGVGVGAGAIYDVIVHRACGDSNVMISFREIAAEAGVSVRTVRRGIEKLCESGWLKRQPPQTADGGGGRLPTCFTIPTVRETEPISG